MGTPCRVPRGGSDITSELVSRGIRCSHLKISFCLCLPTATSSFPELGFFGFVFKSLEFWQGYNSNSDEFQRHTSPTNFKQIKLLGPLRLIPSKNTTPAPTLWTIYKSWDKRFGCILRNPLLFFFWRAKHSVTPRNTRALRCLCGWWREVG